MKKLIWIGIMLFCLVSCERNFDEIADTDQREVTFHVSLENFFSDVLVHNNEDFFFGDNSCLDAQHRIRVTMHCFDDKGELVEKSTIFTTLDDEPTVTIKHLDKNRQYSFIIMADVVKYNTDIDFYETWYQLKTSKWNEFYLTALVRDASAIQNTFHRSVFQLYPDNQDMKIELTPATNNGYVLFVNPGYITKVSGTVLLYQSLYAHNLHGITRVYHTYEIPKQDGAFSTLPITATTPDDVIQFKVITQFGSQKDSIVRNISNVNHRPFVVAVDCQDLSAIKCVYY